jgi:hypothetical protein
VTSSLSVERVKHSILGGDTEFREQCWESYEAVTFVFPSFLLRSRGSAVSTESDYGLDDRTIEVRSPAEEKGFFL